MENDAIRVVPPNSTILLPPSKTASLSAIFSEENRGSVANRNTTLYAAMPKAERGTSKPPKCKDAYGPCKTSVQEEALLSAEHSASTSEDTFPPEDEYFILSYVKYAVSSIPREETAAICFRREGFQQVFPLSSDCDSPRATGGEREEREGENLIVVVCSGVVGGRGCDDKRSPIEAEREANADT